MTTLTLARHAARLRAGSLAVLAAAATVLAGVSPVAASPQAAATTEAIDTSEVSVPSEGLLAEYLFTQTSGSTVANTAEDADGSVGPATVVNGSGELWTGSSLTFTGGPKAGSADWVRLPDDLLTGEESATITIETKFDASMASAWHFLWNIGSDSTTSYYFASLKDKARTAITTSGNGGEVNARATASLVPDRWYSVTSVIDGEAGTIALYIDGVRVAESSTSLTPSSIADQTVNAIGRSPYPDPFYQGEVSSFRVYDRALSASEIAAVSTVDAQLHESTFLADARAALDELDEITMTDSSMVLPDTPGAALSWSDPSEGLTLGGDGTLLHAVQPSPGSEPLAGTITATATVRGVSATKELAVTVEPAAEPGDDYGYLMVHFIEDSDGYAEKIYLDVSRGDNPEQWDPLNGGEPILASQLGTTGVRDPFLTYNPETGTYYIIATDLRVFGGDQGVPGCTTWCYWSSQGSTRLIAWESTDLVNWGEPRSFDVSLDADGDRVAELGMAWAPEATWVDDYYPDGRGAFVMYWSSNVYDDPAHTGSSYNRVLWGATTDFTQDTYAYGGDFVDAGANTIDTTMIQNEGTTYRITKDNGLGKGIYMESTTAERWWEPGTAWTTLQTRIGASWAGGNAGGVEGPAAFKSHSEEKWYLYVDVIPTTGYRPMVTTDLDAGWVELHDPSFYMAPSTKHGGVISLTRAQYDTLRSADATGAVATDLGSVEVAAGGDDQALLEALPATAEVTLAYDRGTAQRPVAWDTGAVDLTTPGTYEVTGTVNTLGANLNTWVGAGGSTAWDAPDRVLGSSTAITVSATVVVAQASGPGLTLETTTRCVVGKVVVVTTVSNTGEAPAQVSVETEYGSRTVTLAGGRSASQAFSTRSASIPVGEATASLDGAGDVSAVVAAASCG